MTKYGQRKRIHNSWSSLPEGQFFERKAAFDRSGARPKLRKAAALARDVVETLSAMANADGGELVMGIENDGTTTGVPHPADKIELVLKAPGSRNYVDPPLRCTAAVVKAERGLVLLHFVVDWSPEVHRLSDGRYVLRINDSNMPFPADQIAALKRTKTQGLFERSFPLGATLDDMDMELAGRCAARAGQESPEDYLQRRRLIEGRNGRVVPCLAALLLFGKDPLRWHPRCGIDFVRWEGTERRHGAQLNVEKRIRIEEPLAVLIERAYDAIRPFIRDRQKLHDLFFTEKLEYPTFVWQEAIVNAVAHRDYSIQGASIEVWMFDDHVEIRSPGMPPHPVTVDALNRREHLHVSRNPLIVRVLTELGYMRELGEGIPRMFAEMDREGFYPPWFEDIGGVSFQVTLRNQPVYDREMLQWLSGFDGRGLSGDQKRLLVYAHTHGDQFTSRDYQKLTGADIYMASTDIKDLIRKGVVQSTGKRSRLYKIVDLEAVQEFPPELTELLERPGSDGTLTNRFVQEVLGLDRIGAGRLLRRWVEQGWLRTTGRGRSIRYASVPR